MNHYYINNNNEICYSLVELESQRIYKNTKIKLKGESSWTTAGKIDDLKKMIQKSDSYNDVRTSNKPHIRKPTLLEYYLLLFILPFIQLFVPILRTPGEQHLSSINVVELSNLKIISSHLFHLKQILTFTLPK